MSKNIIATTGRYDVTFEANVFEPSVMLYFVSTVLGDGYRHYISAHELEEDARKRAQQLQAVARIRQFTSKTQEKENSNV